MKTAIILHGMPDKEEYFNPESEAQSNKHWLPWIQRQLILNGVLAQAIEMPDPYEPVYEKWKAVFEQFKIDQDTILVGHSCGGGFLVRWLSEHKDVQVGKVALVAPWIDTEKSLTTGMFDFGIDERMAERTKGITIIYSDDDYPDVLSSIEILKNKIKDVQVRELTGKKHLTFSGMKTREFPELKDLLLG